MIDLELYRSRIGCFYNRGCKRHHPNAGQSRCHCPDNKFMRFIPGHTPDCNAGYILIKCFCLVLYMYIISVTMAMYIDVVQNNFLSEAKSNANIIIPYFPQNTYNNSILNGLINMGYLTMMAWILNMHFFTHRANKMNIISHKYNKKWFKSKGKVQFIAFLYSSWIALLNLILIVISLPAMVNPGPGFFNHQSSNLSVLYFNARGLFNPLSLKTFTDKMASFQSYVFENKPSIIVVNETWFTNEIHDNEILPNNSYKIYCLDRSLQTHPYDENNPKRFRKNGGGVMIAIRSDLNVESKVIKFKNFD